MRALTWPGMPAPEVLAEAALRLDRTIEVVDVASNEDLAAEMEDGRFDVVFPSDYLVERLVAEGALAALDSDILPLGRLAGWAREPAFDPGCRYSVPFAYGTTGVLAGPMAPAGESWRLLFEPGGPVQMLDEIREVFGAALIATGHGPNELDGTPLEEARAALRRQRCHVVRFDSDDFAGPVAAGEVIAAHAWSGPASAAVRHHRGLRYVVPEEGAILWVTTGAVPADAPDPCASVRLLAELMDPELAARTTLSFGYATPNDAARDLLPDAIRDDPALFPGADTLARCCPLHDRSKIGTGFERAWTALLDGR